MDIIDQTEQHRFVGSEDGQEFQLVYQVDGDRLLLLHTEVPDAIGGRGLAGRLMDAVVERVTASGEVLVPVCPYTSAWLRRHPEVAETVAIDSSRAA